MSLRGPSVSELGERFDAARAWAKGWAGVPAGVRLEYKAVGGRKTGVNEVPARVWVDDFGQFCRLLGVTQAARQFEALVEQTGRLEPVAVGWMVEHPLKVLALAGEWSRIIAALGWIADHAQSGIYLRQLDVPGVDTKFVEGHRAVLTDLLDRRLPPDRIDTSGLRSDFADRFGFRKKPSYVRIRQLGGEGFPGRFSELALRVAELAVDPLPAATVFVVENEVTYLALPAVPDAVVMLGEGYAVSRLKSLPWLADRRLVYWGDIDTHGFRILDRLRQHFPQAASMLMDRATLFAHESQWVGEPVQVRDPLRRLDTAEQALYHDLVEDSFGPAVRLEQERVSFAAIEAFLSDRH